MASATPSMARYGVTRGKLSGMGFTAATRLSSRSLFQVCRYRRILPHKSGHLLTGSHRSLRVTVSVASTLWAASLKLAYSAAGADTEMTNSLVALGTR